MILEALTVYALSGQARSAGRYSTVSWRRCSGNGLRLGLTVGFLHRFVLVGASFLGRRLFIARQFAGVTFEFLEHQFSLGNRLEPIYDAQFASIRASRAKAMDETPIKAGRSGPDKLKSEYF